jgi:hypothetical protein
MQKGDYYFIYVIIGLSYWFVNIFVRKLHKDNDEHEGWFLAPMWLLLWPMCFVGLAIVFASNIREKIKKF